MVLIYYEIQFASNLSEFSLLDLNNLHVGYAPSPLARTARACNNRLGCSASCRQVCLVKLDSVEPIDLGLPGNGWSRSHLI